VGLAHPLDPKAKYLIYANERARGLVEGVVEFEPAKVSSGKVSFDIDWVETPDVYAKRADTDFGCMAGESSSTPQT